MNNRSLAHSNVQKQQRSSWIDDPFEVGHAFKGLTLVTPKRNLSNYAEELAYQHGTYQHDDYCLYLSQLNDDEQAELVRLYMETTGRETSECVHGTDFSIDNDYTCALLALLKEDCQENRDTFADTTRKNVIKYYSPALQLVLDEACHALMCNLHNEAGYHSYQDSDSDDVHWSRF